MNDNGTDIVGVSLERSDLFRSIVVVDADLEIVGAADNPILAGDKPPRSDRDIGELEGFDDSLMKIRRWLRGLDEKAYLSFVRPNIGMAAVECCEDLVLGSATAALVDRFVHTHDSVGWKSMPLTRSERANSCLYTRYRISSRTD